MRYAVIDFDVSGGPDVEDWVPIGVVVMVEGSVKILYTPEAIDDAHPRYVAMVGRLEVLKEQADSGEARVNWPYVLARVVEESYPGIKFRIGTPIDDDITAGEVYEMYVARREKPEDIQLDDPQVPSTYFGSEFL